MTMGKLLRVLYGRLFDCDDNSDDDDDDDDDSDAV